MGPYDTGGRLWMLVIEIYRWKYLLWVTTRLSKPNGAYRTRKNSWRKKRKTKISGWEWGLLVRRGIPCCILQATKPRTEGVPFLYQFSDSCWLWPNYYPWGFVREPHNNSPRLILKWMHLFCMGLLFCSEWEGQTRIYKPLLPTSICFFNLTSF